MLSARCTFVDDTSTTGHRGPINYSPILPYCCASQANPFFNDILYYIMGYNINTAAWCQNTHILLAVSLYYSSRSMHFIFYDENFIINFPVFLRRQERSEREGESSSKEQHAPYMHSNGNRGKNYVSKRYYYRVVERICFSLASYYSIHKIGPGHFSLLRRKGAFLAVKLVISRKQHRPNLKVGI